MNRKHRLPSSTYYRSADGRFKVALLGASYSSWRDPYHLLLTISWPGFLALIFLSYLAINAVFALAYLAGGDCIENARPGSFLDAFFFSVQTIATIGYGKMSPRTIYAQIFHMTSDGQRAIDYNRFHDVTPVQQVEGTDN